MSTCKKCEGIVVMHAFSTSNCENCGVEISSPHIPSYTLCDNCAGDNKCVQCGGKIQYYRFVYKDENWEAGYTIIKAEEREQAIAIFEHKFPSKKWYRTDEL